MDQHQNPSGQMSDFFDQLPTPPKEKVFQAVWYGVLGLAGVAGFLVVMPFVNQALTLGLAGATLFLKLGLVGLVGVAGTYFAMSFWEPYKRWVESMAHQTTIAIHGDDPITPLRMWLVEVRQDCEGIENSANDIDGIIAENEKVEADNLQQEAEASENFATAVSRYGENSIEARNASIDKKGFRTRADNAARVNVPLKELYQMLFEIAQATRLGEREAEMSVGTAEQEWRAALKAEKAMGNAQRSLNKRSARYVSATMAFDIIRQKYAGSFGQLRSLRRLSQDTISKMTLSGDVAHDKALAQLREQSRKLLSYNPGIPAHDFSKAPQAVVVSSSGGTVADLDLFGKQ